jgi:alcohol dehydrogenase class IV
MNPFDLYSVPRITFGRGKVAELGAIVASLGQSALVVHNGGEVGGGGAVDKAADSLRKANIRVTFHRQRGEPTVKGVDAALAAARQNDCDVLVGLGGGSAIDCAQATAGLLTNGGAALDYMEVIGHGRKITRPAAPWVAVPTTAGTGAEVTRNAVIGSPEHQYKASLRSEHLMARVALVDPELGVDTPPEVTAASGMDALVQLIESYTSKGANDLTDALAWQGITVAADSLVKVFNRGDEVAAREVMAYAALLGGITLTNAGLGAVHGFAAPLGANFPAPHGVICARLVPAVAEANAAASTTAGGSADRLRERYDRIGGILEIGLGEVELRFPPVSDELPRLLRTLVELLQIPRLSTYGLREEHIPEMVALAKKSSSMKFNPVVLADDVLSNILRSAL